MKNYPCHIECHSCGYCVVWYRDDDGNSGYGDNPEVNFWWGATQQECIDRSRLPAPKAGWANIVEPSYTDHATLTGMYDRY